MESLLNRGVNFSNLPQHMGLTRILTDFKKLAIRVIWHEYDYGKEDQREYGKPVFKSQKKCIYIYLSLTKTFSGSTGYKYWITGSFFLLFFSIHSF